MDEGNSRQQPFPTTQWSLIVRAAADDPEDRARALAEICTLYWPPVYAFIRSKGHSPHDAEDSTQALFAELLERNDFAKADAGQGRLRSYLLTAAKNHLSSEHRRASRQKRGGDAVVLSIEAVKAEQQGSIIEPTDDLTPDRMFERQWAMTVLDRVVSVLEQRYMAKGQEQLFRALRPFILSTDATPAYAPIAEELQMSEPALRVALHRLRQRYADALREQIRATLGKSGDVEEEIRFLISIFG